MITTGTDVTEYVWEGDRLIREVNPDRTITFLYDGGEYGVQFLYDDIVDQQQPRNIRVDSDTYRINVCCNLNLYSDVVKCLYVYLDVYDDEGVYCVAKAVDFAKGYYELILYEIKEPWQAMIRECTGIDSV